MRGNKLISNTVGNGAPRMTSRAIEPQIQSLKRPAGRRIDLFTTHQSGYNSSMKRASITDAKNGLSALLDRVRHGETVVIEDRGIPVAQLTPVAARSTSADAGRLARLERQGIVRPPASPGAAKLAATPPPRTRRPVTLSQLAIAERREGW